VTYRCKLAFLRYDKRLSRMLFRHPGRAVHFPCFYRFPWLGHPILVAEQGRGTNALLQCDAMSALTVALRQLQKEHRSVSTRLAQVNHALAALKAKGVRRKRTMSAAGIARIRAAQKARWAEWRKGKKR